MFLQFVVWYNAIVGIYKEIFMVTSFSARTGRHVLYVLLPVCCIDGRCAGLKLPAVEDGGQKKLRPIFKFVINLYKRNKNKTKGNKVW